MRRAVQACALHDGMPWTCKGCGIAGEFQTTDTAKCEYRRRGHSGWDHVYRGHYCCNCAKPKSFLFVKTHPLDGANWSRLGCQHCQDRRSQDYRCQAYQAKGMMNWSCRFCDKDKGVHFKGMYSKKLFCTDPRQVKVISGIQSTADANDTTAAASGGGIDKDPPSKLEEKIMVEEHKEEQQAQAATVAKAVEEEHQALFEQGPAV